MEGLRRLRRWQHAHSYPVLWLVAATLMLTLLLATGPSFAARAFQSESPLPTNTTVPTITSEPTDTPVPTGTPVPTQTPFEPTATLPFAPTATAIVIDTPLPEGLPTLPPVAATLIPSPTPTLPLAPATEVAPPTASLPTVAAPLVTSVPSVQEGIVVTQAYTITSEGQVVLLAPGQAATGAGETQPNADALVRLIDAFVLSSAYFLLGCGLIVFIAAAVGFYLLHHRSKQLAGSQDKTPPPPA